MQERFIKLRKDTIQFNLPGMVLEISVFKVTTPEVFDNSAFCMMLVPPIALQARSNDDKNKIMRNLDA